MPYKPKHTRSPKRTQAYFGQIFLSMLLGRKLLGIFQSLEQQKLVFSSLQ